MRTCWMRRMMTMPQAIPRQLKKEMDLLTFFLHKGAVPVVCAFLPQT